MGVNRYFAGHFTGNHLGLRIFLAFAFSLYFNVLFTFVNVPSTPWIRLVPLISIEVVLGLVALVLVGLFDIKKPRYWKPVVATLVFILSLVRYVVVSAPGVMGRTLDVRGDLPHVFGVIGMFWEALPRFSILLIVFGLVVSIAIFIGLNYVGFLAIERAIDCVVQRGSKRVLLIATVAGLLLIPVSVVTVHSDVFARSFTTILRDQFTDGPPFSDSRPKLTDSHGDRSLAKITPEMMANTRVDGLQGASVFLIFLESYGVTLIEDARHFTSIAPRFKRFENRLTTAGFSMASSQITAPTFAGGSWRSHATVLSGVRVADQRDYETLVGSGRRTLVHLLNDEGYRTVAAEPAIRGPWPDGDFYGFEYIYDAAALDYQGPDIGWWKIPDQYTLYQIYKREILRSSRPVFAKIALIMTHIPYFPIPPYVANWSLFETGTAYREHLPSIAADDYRDLYELSSRYVDAFLYELDILEDFILRFVPAGSLVIIMGDHQPPKLATHDNDSWAVPVHLISSNPDLVAPFARHGFQSGVLPSQTSEFHMEHFLAAFLDVFGTSTPIDQLGP